jgi:hypothetical protein
VRVLRGSDLNVCIWNGGEKHCSLIAQGFQLSHCSSYAPYLEYAGCTAGRDIHAGNEWDSAGHYDSTSCLIIGTVKVPARAPTKSIDVDCSICNLLEFHRPVSRQSCSPTVRLSPPSICRCVLDEPQFMSGDHCICSCTARGHVETHRGGSQAYLGGEPDCL